MIYNKWSYFIISVKIWEMNSSLFYKSNCFLLTQFTKIFIVILIHSFLSRIINVRLVWLLKNKPRHFQHSKLSKSWTIGIWQLVDNGVIHILCKSSRFSYFISYLLRIRIKSSFDIVLHVRQFVRCNFISMWSCGNVNLQTASLCRTICKRSKY